jgi:N-acetylmuramoyl-L-alanine amidase
MIRLLLAALQLSAATLPPAGTPPERPLVVKDASRSVSVALVDSPDGPMLRADALRPVLPVTVSHLMGERWMLIVNGTAIEVEAGSRLARVGKESYQLAAAPVVRKGALLVPLQLVVEIVPRVVNNLVWDPERFELRAFTSVTKFSDREAAKAAASTRVKNVVQAGDARRTSVPDDGSLVSSRASIGPLHSRKLVVVDAGHGGPDGGMHGPIGGGPPIAEKSVTLTVAKRVGAALGRRGIDVKYTRTTDTLIALSDRGRIANEAHADLFVSIHVNAANPNWKEPGASRGFETYFLAEAKTEDARRVEEMENEVVKFETKSAARAGDPLSFVLNDMAQNEHLRESNELAELIQRRMGRVHPGSNRGVKQAGFRVLVTAFMPAVLVEIGFGTNAADAAYMTDPARVDELSAAVADAVLEYLQRYERRVSTISAPSSSGGGLGPQ